MVLAGLCTVSTSPFPCKLTKKRVVKGVTGRGYKDHTLQDEEALVASVDLNLVREDMAETPEQSECTSIKPRSHQLKMNPSSIDEANTPVAN